MLRCCIMKFLFPAIAITLLTGCNSNMVTHRRDFRPSKPKGEWSDYHRAVRHGQEPEPKKELKDR